MSNYTPTTEWLRIMVGYSMTTALDRNQPIEVARQEGYKWFDRWLEQHDAEVANAAEECIIKLLAKKLNCDECDMNGFENDISNRAITLIKRKNK